MPEAALFSPDVGNPAASVCTIAVGALGALALGAYQAAHQKIPMKAIVRFSALSLFLGVFCAHLLYALLRFSYMWYEESILSFLVFWQGNYALYGGLLGVMAAAWISGQASGQSPWDITDAYAAAGMLMIAVVRVSEGLSGQGYGEYLLEEGFFSRFPFAVYDGYYEQWAWAIFGAEALVALLLMVYALADRRRNERGDRTLLTLGLYAAMQIVLESLRRDNYLRWGFVRCNEVLSAAMLLLVLLCYACRARGRHFPLRAVCLSGCALLIAFCALLEFAMEDRIPFLRFLDVNGCYWAMLLSCLLLCGCVLIMRQASFKSPTIAQEKEHL